MRLLHEFEELFMQRTLQKMLNVSFFDPEAAWEVSFEKASCEGYFL